MKISFNGKWKYQVDPLNAGMKESWWELTWIINQYAKLEEINLPNNWNRLPELKRYEGIVWFFYSFELKEDQKNLESSELFLQFKAANYETHLWINGVDYGVHEGNFLPFRFRINSEAINYKESNYIAVRVENLRKKDRIPTSSRDWFNYGGIYRDIDFLILNKYRINWIGIKSNIHMRGSATVNVHYEFKVPKKRINLSESKNHEIKWNLYYLGDLSSQNQERRQKKVLLKSGSHLTSYKDRKDNFSIQLDEAQVWSPANPRLYEIELTLTESEELYITRFGIREVIIKDSRLFLNRKSISLQGVNLHEELVPYGRSIPIEERRKDVITIKQMGFNALRTAHYPHDESIYDICDEEGLLVLEEIPVYWGINFSSKKMLALAARMLRTMIRRDFNHPSIIMWSAGNEIPITETACFQFMA
ncbi:MAG: glycoside hydrolase family 2 protein, partial [Promethearchaeota archaeon]